MDWWQEVDDNWADLVRLIEKFHPAHRREDDMMNYGITAPNAERACAAIRSDIQTEHPISLATQARANRDAETLHRIFNEVWFGAPESRSVFAEPCFGLLCDLCSEYPDLSEN